MKQTIIYVGLDVDDNQYHGAAFDKQTGEIVNFKCRPTLKGLLGQLEKLRKYFPSAVLKVCYEASYLGYTLQRDLNQNGVHCDVVSPSSIPTPRSRTVKTDRLDAEALARYYANDMLTVVHVPGVEQEQDRDFLRSRQFLSHQQTELRSHILALMRRSGLHYKEQTQCKSHWTKHHYNWLERIAETLSGSLKANLALLLQHLQDIDKRLADCRVYIDTLAQTPHYAKSVSALTCYKGVKNLFALTMITEIGNIKRFAHPRQLASWMGMDIREYSSGGKPHRFGITKCGNRYLRTAFIEANQRSYKTAYLSQKSKERRANTAPEFIDIADRCLRR